MKHSISTACGLADSAESPKEPPDSARRGVPASRLYAVLVLAAGFVYVGSLPGPFLFDDLHAVVDNPYLADMLPDGHLWAADQSPLWGRPLTAFTFMLNYAAGGLTPWGYRAVNVALHAANACLLAAWVRRTLTCSSVVAALAPRAERLAFTVALLWVVHPLNTEAVANITQRTELLASFFYLLVMYAAVRTHATGGSARWTRIAAVACVLGMASKEVMVTAPVMVAFYDRAFWFASWREAWRRRRGFYLSLAAGWIALAALMSLYPRRDSVGFHLGLGPLDYLGNQCIALPRYLRLAFWPVGLCLDYGTGRPPAWPSLVPGASLILGLLVATAIAWRTRPAMGFLGVWFFGILAPTSSVVPIATEIAAERRMYLPLVACVAAVVVGADRLLLRTMVRCEARTAATLRRTLVGCTAAILAMQTIARGFDYHDPVRMWTTVVQIRPLNYRGWGNLGAAYFQRGDYAAAVPPLERALEIAPHYYPSYYALGASYDMLGRTADARRLYDLALKHDPRFAEVHNNLGRLAEQRPDFAEAERRYRLAIEYAPNWAVPRYNLGRLLDERGRSAEAIEHLREALRLDPTLAPAATRLRRIETRRADVGQHG